MAGIKTYIEKGYADQGKGEKYLLGIIRNQNGNGAAEGPQGPVMKSTGSPALDDHYRREGVTVI